MKFKYFLFLLIWVSISAPIFAQTGSIKGNVLDSINKKPVALVNLSIKSKTKPTLVFTAASNSNGLFTIDKINIGDYILTISYLGYKNILKNISVKNNQELNLGAFLLTEDANLLNAVNVVSKSPEVVVKKDTLEFSTKNIPTRENAVVEDILKKIPGIEVDKTGNVTAQGEKVTKIRVDGKEFFSNDPKMATKNIPADVIDKIQIIDNLSDQSQFTGVDDGAREKIINITTKPGKNQGTFGSLNASQGDIGRYSVNGNVNKFTKDKRISVVADFNNINKKNFTGDAAANTGGNFRGSFGGNSGTDPGIETVSSAGINYDADLDDATKVNLSYSFDKSAMNLIQNSVVQNLSSDNTAINTINQNNQSNTLRHRLNALLDHKIDSLNSIRNSLSIALSDNSNAMLQDYSNIFNNGERSTNGKQQTNQTNFTPAFTNNLLLRHRFKKKGRSISLNMNTSINDGSLDIFNVNNATIFDSLANTNGQRNIDQYNSQINSSFSNTLKLVYTEPIVKNVFLEINALNRYNYSNVKRYVFDYDIKTLQYSQLNDSLTNIYSNQFYTNSAGTSINYNNKKINANIGFSLQNTDILSNNLSRDRKIYQNQINYLPSAMFQWRLSTTKRFRFNYRGATNQPSIDQIAPIVDNTDALNLRIGNADLKQEFNHSFRLGFNSFNTKSEVMFFSFIGLNLTQNAISNKISIDEQGRTVQQAVNVNGVFGSNAFMNFGFPIVKKKLRFNMSVMGSYNKGVSYLREVMNQTNSYIFNNNYKLQYNAENFDATLGAGLIFNRALYSAQASSNTRFITTTASLDVGYMMPGSIRIALDLNYYNNTGRGQGFDRAYTMMNGYVSRQFLKSKLLTLKFSVNDALKSNLGINRTVNTFSISDVNYNVLQRYYLLTLTYNLSQFGGKPMTGNQEKGKWKGGNDGGRGMRSGRTF